MATATRWWIRCTDISHFVSSIVIWSNNFEQNKIISSIEMNDYPVNSPCSVTTRPIILLTNCLLTNPFTSAQYTCYDIFANIRILEQYFEKCMPESWFSWWVSYLLKYFPIITLFDSIIQLLLFNYQTMYALQLQMGYVILMYTIITANMLAEYTHPHNPLGIDHLREGTNKSYIPL